METLKTGMKFSLYVTDKTDKQHIRTPISI